MLTEHKQHNVLDRGFIKLVDSMGDDAAIVQAARVSYSKGTKTKREDDKLIEYLLKNKHWTPFEMVVLKFHVKLPMFVARQWQRHRASTYNELSARYSILSKDYYIPELDRVQSQSLTNKQGSGKELSLAIRKVIIEQMQEHSKKSYKSYESLLELGLARELARAVLPVNFYTEFYWKVDLRNLFHFITLRRDDHAQYEIRVYAEALLEMLKELVPIATQAYLNNEKEQDALLTRHKQA